jgi:hypothetical protein
MCGRRVVEFGKKSTNFRGNLRARPDLVGAGTKQGGVGDFGGGSLISGGTGSISIALSSWEFEVSD